MQATLGDGIVRAGPAAREQFYDARGYGMPADEGLLLAPVEAAHLLARGDLDAVDGMDFREFLASTAVSEIAFLVYKDLRGRGFYLSPARWADEDRNRVDFVVYPRGAGPWDDAVAYRVRVASEREDVSAASLGEETLAIVDEESAITYLEVERCDPRGSTMMDVPSEVPATLLADRVFCWDPPAALYESGFFGQPLDDAGPLQLSLVEAAYLARQGGLVLRDPRRHAPAAEPEQAAGEESAQGRDDAFPGAVEAENHREPASNPAAATAIRERGRSVEGDRFDRRLRVYEVLRDRGIVPKTGFKFGADFRTYANVPSVEELGHAELLVRVLPADHVFSPRDLALDVRLAHGVRKEMVYAFVATGPDGPVSVDWISVGRLTP